MNPLSSNAKETWYKEGLAFRCTQCGKCCTGAPGFVYVNDEEITAIAEFLGEPREVVYQLYTHQAARSRSLREKVGGDCVFYQKEVGCTIYPFRPQQCRTWPFWESNLRTEKDWDQTCQICPGSGQGDLIPVEEITRRMKVIAL